MKDRIVNNLLFVLVIIAVMLTILAGTGCASAEKGGWRVDLDLRGAFAWLFGKTDGAVKITPPAPATQPTSQPAP